MLLDRRALARPRLLCAIALTALAASACGTRSSREVAAPLDESIGYPAGGYRNRLTELSDVAPSLAHIVIAHSASTELPTVTANAALPGADSRMWLPLAKTQRSREEARSLALQISRDARTGKKDFATLAQRFSDDRASAALGGALGVVPALALPGTYLDALLALSEGEVSRVFETRAGFHVVKRMPVPRGDVAFGMLVVKYDGVLGWWGNGRKLARTREQALEIARSLAAKARAAPASFPELVQRYSDELGASPGGDRGRWRRAEPFFAPIALHAVGELNVGGISDPIDTEIGFAVLRRQPLADQNHVAASAIVFSYQGVEYDLFQQDRSEAQARAIAHEALAALEKDPTRFASLREQHCGKAPFCEPRAWPFRHGDFGFDAVVEALREGEIARTVLETPAGFVILRRERAAAYSPEPVAISHDIPDVKPMSLDQIIADVEPENLVAGFKNFSQRAADELQLSGSERTRFFETAQDVADGLLRADRAERMQALAAGRARFAVLLGPERSEALQGIRQRWLLEIQGWQP